MLEGIRVVEMGLWVAGPAAAGLLADWGADVIKVEPPSGDPMRAFFRLSTGSKVERNPPFDLDNRGKRSVALDLRVPAAREAAQRIVDRADVFVTNLRAAALARAGLAYEDVRAENPRLIYAGLSGYGQRGPEKDRAAFDYAAFWARAGAMASLGEPEGPPPTQRPAMGDHPAGLALAGAVAAALYHRERTGQGQEVHLSLFHAGMWMMATDIQTCLITGLGAAPTGRLVPNALWNHYKAKDEKWFHLVMLQADRYWSGFCAALERPDLEHDERYADIFVRAQHGAELIAALDEIFATRTRAEWAERFDRHQLVWGPVQSITDVVADPQARALDAFAKVQHRSGDDIEIVRSPVDFGATPASVRHGAPELGEHTEAVLLEYGYSWDDIAKLKEQGAIG